LQESLLELPTVKSLSQKIPLSHTLFFLFSRATPQQLTTASGIPISDNQNSVTTGPHGPVLLQDFHLIEKLQHFDHEWYQIVPDLSQIAPLLNFFYFQYDRSIVI